MTKKELRILLTKGKTNRVLAELQSLTADDIDLHNEVVQIFAQHTENERQKRLNITKQEDVRIEQNRINSVIIIIIDKLPDDLIRKKGGPNWEKTALWLTIILAAGFTGHTIKYFYGKEENPLIIGPPDTMGKATKVIPSHIQPEQKKAGSPITVSPDTTTLIILPIVPPDTTLKEDSKGNGEIENPIEKEDPAKYRDYTARFIDKKNEGLKGVNFYCEECDPKRGMSEMDGSFTIRRHKSVNTDFSPLTAYIGSRDTTVRIYWSQQAKNIKIFIQ